MYFHWIWATTASRSDQSTAQASVAQLHHLTPISITNTLSLLSRTHLYTLTLRVCVRSETWYLDTSLKLDGPHLDHGAPAG